jgi:hypothetical protein
MGVTIKKRGGKWYVFVNYHGRRKAKCVGSSRDVAEKVQRQLEARLALGDLGFFAAELKIPTFGEYATRWMREHASLHCKPSTIRGLKLHLRPRFESVHLDRLSRDAIKTMFVELSEQGLSRNTLKNVLIAVRTILNGAIEDKVISINPAGKLGKFIPRDEENFEVTPLSREEFEQFLTGAQQDAPISMLYF